MSTFLAVGLALMVFGGGMLAAGPARAANDYCVVCPNAKPKKVHNSIGGEVGKFAVGVANPGCSVTYYDGRNCHDR